MMTASGLSDPTTALPEATDAVESVPSLAAAIGDLEDAKVLETESKKRKTRSSTAAETLDDAAAIAAGGDIGADDEEFSEEDNEAAMNAVMAKMKEANDAMLHTTALPNGQLVPRGGEQRVQLYDSKRMSRVSFNSWYEFDTYFEMYMQETFQPFRMRSSCSVDAYRRNQQKVMMNNKNSRGRRIEFPDSAIHHHRIYMCTHAMKARCRGATTRPGQKYRGIGCIAKINVKISPSDNPNKYMVIVTDQVVTHNHPISKEIYESYPDVLLKTMRRNQLSTALLTRQPSPKFELPAQSQKYERAVGFFNSVAEVMARLSDEEYEAQMNHLQKFYTSIITDNAQV
ncbi:hypothetical protein Poli38472_009097 [Pythium oligandrum]|uniref:FAR1 domain-containing protein n=1 Tax=Pythium oligandrum TaxID=41045 RepID=A0A8K1CKH8_PYTOL|nr:hypothetical protein Poli38472_009097 [Pythium oligandrum]|eukprot:TMW64930.1 hypothetical protein Poli38472_009097 [Pythium oligandrum]